MALITKEGASLSFTRQWIYDVFLNFTGEGTRKDFVDHLYAALDRKGIITCSDHELERGKTKWEAIEESRISVVILSKHYADSLWCLFELAKIVQCQKEKGQTILPVFFDVDPSEVRNQTGSFGEAFEHLVKFLEENMDEVQRWRAALAEVANIPGWALQDMHESKVIQDIVGVILKGVSPPFSVKDLVGIDSHVEKINTYLRIGLNEVRMIGICGMGGIGKTTIAKVVYERLSNRFEGGSFLSNVRVVTKRRGLICLQEKLLSDVLMVRDIRIFSVEEGVNQIRNRLHTKRILLVLDDVDQLEQLEILAGKGDWFGPGSTIIITTRDEYLLSRHGVDEIYKPKEMNNEEALHLFSLKCFKNKRPPEAYMEASNHFVNYAAGLPLAIDVLGSFLLNRSVTEWENELKMVKEHSLRQVLDVLQISFDGLEEIEREIFLHIACFFNGGDKDRVVEILDCLGYDTDFILNILIRKSLLRVLSDNRLWMHDLLQEMGWQMVRRECAIEPGKRSRLWLHDDIDKVLTENTGTEAVQGMVLDLPTQKEAHWNPEAFSKMCNLRLLKIQNVQLPYGLTHFPNALRFVEWNGYPLKSLPQNFKADKLVELNMCHGKIKQLWGGVKYLDKLKFIKLSHSRDLNRTPDFTRVPNLVKIDLEGCSNLVEVHPSIGALKRLSFLNLKDCKCLRSLPKKIETESLEILILSGCSKVKKICEFSESMQQLRELSLNGTAIKKLPSSITHLTGLTLLNLRDCKNLVCLPSVVYSLKSLRELDLSGCSKLVGSQDHEILHTYEPEIKLTSSEKEKFLSDRGKEVVETSNEKGRTLSILEAEIETVPSQTEGQRKSKLYMHVGEPVDPPTPQSVSTSGTSKKAAAEQSKLSVHVGEPVEPSTPQSVSTSGMRKNAAVELTTIPPSGKSKGSQPIDVVEIELPCPPDSQQLLELRRGAKRSIEHTVGMILSHVSNTTSKRIGVHGSGGIGKTSVLKALINHPKTKYLFDVNIWVSVSRNWSMRKIQNEVLRQLSLLPADSKTDSEIAEELFQSLKCRRFLLLLDDVWEQIDLHAIGIPDLTLENGCRMIIATRFLGVCHIMATDVEIQVEGLLEEEAWELFREQVGGIVDSPNIEPHARALVHKCHGLPLLIIVTGRALTKEIDALAWMHAVREFSLCSAHGMYGFESLIQKLKFSYDRLEGLELKSCFLYCALFPEDWEVSILDLVEYWIHEGLISGNWTDAHKRVI